MISEKNEWDAASSSCSNTVRLLAANYQIYCRVQRRIGRVVRATDILNAHHKELSASYPPI